MRRHRHALVAIGLALLLVAAGRSAGTDSPGATTETPTDRTPASETNSTIHVAGSGSADAEPNQAVVRMAVEAVSVDAATARRRLAANTSRMRAALDDIGDDRTTTERYDIYQDRRPPREDGADPRVQYRASHDFEITVADPDRVGEVIDTAVRNGATEVADVSFSLSTERRRTLERRARSAAMADARSKARALATDTNLTVTGVQVIRTGRSGAPRTADAGAAMTETPVPTGAPPSDIESGPVSVTATVQVVYEAGHRANATGRDGSS